MAYNLEYLDQYTFVLITVTLSVVFLQTNVEN